MNDASVSDLIATMRDVLCDYQLDTVTVVANTSLGKLKLSLSVGAPLVIEDFNGHSIVGDVLE